MAMDGLMEGQAWVRMHSTQLVHVRLAADAAAVSVAGCQA